MQNKMLDLNLSRKSMARNRVMSSVTAIFFLIVFVYLVQIIIRTVGKPNIEVEVVRTGSVDVPRVIEGIAIRDEKVYRSTRAGALVYYTAEYDRVKKSALICCVEDAESVREIKEQLIHVDESILKLQERRYEISGLEEQTKKINEQIKGTIDAQIFRFMTAEHSLVYPLREWITQNVGIRNQILLTKSDGSLADLAEQRRRAQSAMAENVTEMLAEETGILCYRLDGAEESLTPENLDQADKIIADKNFQAAELFTKSKVEEGTPVFKIVASNIWFIGANIPNDLLQGVEPGDNKTIYIESRDAYQRLPVQVQSITPGSHESFVLYRSTQYMMDYLSDRNIRFKTIDSVRTGYKISKSAILDQQEVKGVYRVNNGIAEFREIVLPDDPPTGGSYIVLDPGVNKNIQAYDKIVTDASKVKENQIIYE